MKRLHLAGLSGPRLGLLGVLSALALSASAAGHKLGAAPAGAAGAGVQNEPVGRFIIQYRSGNKLEGPSSATPVDERQQAAAQVARSAGFAGMGRLGYLKSVSPRLHVARLEQPVSRAEALLVMQRLRADPAVEDVVIDRRVKPHSVPNDPFFSTSSPNNQWHLQDSSVVPGGLNVASAWDSTEGAGVVVAVLDGGYLPHVDLLPNVLAGYDFISADNPVLYGGQSFWTANDGDARDSDPRDPGDWVSEADVAAGYCDTAASSSWHGTHVAGLVAAVGNNREGGLGVAFGARVLPVRVLGRCGGYTSDILTGARWAAGLPVLDVTTRSTPAKVLNLSLGLPGACDAITQSVVDEIRARHVSIVASSGNDGGRAITAPANCKGVMAVTGHTREGDSADYANVGPGTAISAPGGGDNTVPSLTQPGSPRWIASTGDSGTDTPRYDNSYLLFRGTSMAAPQVAGVLALLAAARPGVFAMATLESLVRGAARAFPAGGYCATNPDGLAPGFCGSGLLDAQAALTALNAAPSASADLELSQRLPSSTVAPGQSFTFAVKVTNWGPLASSGLRLTQSVGPGWQIQSVTTSAGLVSHNASGTTATLPALAVGGAWTLNVTALVTASSGDVVSSAAVSSASADPALLNNTDAQVVAVLVPDGVPDGGGGGGGGGCTVAPGGQTDAGLVLLALAALLMSIWRRRSARYCAAPVKS